MQLIKGGFSHRLASNLPTSLPNWQRGFRFPKAHRIRTSEDFETRRHYIHHNPVRARLCQLPEDFPHSCAFRAITVRTITP